MIENVEDLPAELEAIAFLKCEVLEDGSVQVVEPCIAENVAAHVAVGPQCWRNQDRVAVRGDEAAEAVQRGRAWGFGYAVRNPRRSPSASEGGAVPALIWVCITTAGSAGEAAAVGDAVRAGGEVERIAGDVPTIGAFPRAADIVPGVPDVPGLRGGIAVNGVDLPAFQQLAKALDPGNIVGGCECEAMANVEVAVRVLGSRISTVLRQRPKAVDGAIVEAMGIRVTGNE